MPVALEKSLAKALPRNTVILTVSGEINVSISMYEASVPVFSARLKALSGVLAAAEKNAAERKIDPQVFVTARLAPDMYALARQVQIATDHAKGAPSRLAGREVPKYDDDEASFAELQARIDKTLAYLATFSAAEFEGSDDRTVQIRLGGNDMALSGLRYLLDVAMPNFYFHVTTAYNILRHNGVPLGKAVFLRGH
ncbi:DUF1993 domain-containing protein [Mesorhizobium sp. A556]